MRLVAHAFLAVCASSSLSLSACGGHGRAAPPPKTPDSAFAPPPPLPSANPIAEPESRSALPPPGPTEPDRGPAPPPGQPIAPSPLLAGQPGPRPDSQAKQAPADGLEWGVNREGFDYASFRIRPDPARCRAACAGDPGCVAFTYIKPHVRARSAICQLKQAVPQPTYDDCCVSGVVRAP